MLGLIPRSKKRSAPARNGGAVAPTGEFPIYLGRMREEFDRLFDRLAGGFPALFEDANEGWRWGLDVKEEEHAVVVCAEAPGFEAGDFNLEVRGDQLILRAKHKSEKKNKEAQESYEQECYDVVTLPAEIDKEKVTAEYRNGVLTITLPKSFEGKGKKITVKGS